MDVTFPTSLATTIIFDSYSLRIVATVTPQSSRQPVMICSCYPFAALEITTPSAATAIRGVRSSDSVIVCDVRFSKKHSRVRIAGRMENSSEPRYERVATTHVPSITTEPPLVVA